MNTTPDKPNAPTARNIHTTVAQRYGEIAQSGGASCCAPAGDTARATGDYARTIGYREEDLADLPDGANLGLGCGSPTALAALQPGQTVVDLGSGAGIDCFLAAKQVGPTGRVIGVDMTDAMLEKASQYAADKGYDHVEFRKGQIEQLPLEDNSVDVILSNCVINLSPDKARVFREIARVLKPGGYAAISDIVLLQPLPEAILKDVEAYIGCISGADQAGTYLGHAIVAGLDLDRAHRKGYDVMSVLGCSPEAGKLIEKLPADFDGQSHVISLDMIARKPGSQGGDQPSTALPIAGACC